MRRGVLSVLAVSLLAVVATPAVASAARFVPGEVIVSYENNRLRPAAVESLPGVEDSAPIGAMKGVRLLELGPGQSVVEVVARLESRPGVRYAEPNWIYHVDSTGSKRGRKKQTGRPPFPNDPMFGSLWGIRNSGQNVSPYPELNVFGFKAIDTGAWRAWRYRHGSRQLVGVIDTGVSRDHPDLKRNLARKVSRNFAPAYAGGPVRPRAWDDMHGHGTHVAGTIAATGNNGIGVTGINWRARLVALRVCDANADCTAAAMAAAIDYAGRRQIPVVNMSLGSEPGDPYSESRLVVEAIRRHPRTLLVNAAGNESSNNDRHKEWPCSAKVRNLLCVAAFTAKGQLADFSNWGRRSVDLGAPGQFILSTWPNKVYPLERIFFRDGIGAWNLQGWQEVPGEQPVLRYDGTDAEASASPDQTIDLSDMRYCRVNASLAGRLSGNQTLAVQYSKSGGSWITSPIGLKAGDLKSKEEDFFFYIGGATGDANMRIRILYRSGGTTAPAPSLTMSSIDVTCIKAMPAGGVYRHLDGTSMASPHAAGVATLVRGVYPKLRGVRLKRLLMGTATKLRSLRGKTVTGSRINALRAVQKARRLKRNARR